MMRKSLDFAGTIARWAVGGLFIYMGLKKALDPATFLKLIQQYDLTTAPVLLNSIAAALPWFETFCGLLLLVGAAVRGTALVLLGMLLPFTLLIYKRALAIASAKTLALCLVKFDCGCGMGEVFVCPKIAENCFLMLLAVCMLVGCGKKWSLRFSLLDRTETNQ